MSPEFDGMPHRAEVQDLLIEQMRRDLTRPKWWKTIWGRLAIAGGVLTLAGSGIAAVMLLEDRPVSETAIVWCLKGAYLNPDGSLPGPGSSFATPDGVVEITDAEAMCDIVWESGQMESTDPLDPSPAPGVAPSEYTTCVTEHGEPALVPGRVECSVLKLHPYQPAGR